MNIGKMINVYFLKLVKYDKTSAYNNLATMYFLMGLINAVMTIININTENTKLAVVTFIIAVVCMLVAILSTMHKIHSAIFVYTVTIFHVVCLNYFIITGMADGFSPLWILLLPVCALFLYGRKNGAILGLIQLIIILFLFYTPIGMSILQYNYTKSFIARYPILYIAVFIVSWYIETSRNYTYQALIATKEQYKEMYVRDSLTGIYNRYGFNGFMDKAISKLNGEDKIALLIIDIDHFKYVNDLYGHPCGDAVLKCVANTISNTVAHRGVVCRWGGEEFAVLITDMKYCVEYKKIAEEVRKAVEQNKCIVDNNSINVTVSIGGACSNKIFENNSEIIINIADDCLYKAKGSGRNKIICKPVAIKQEII